jgi:hypothetical protein
MFIPIPLNQLSVFNRDAQKLAKFVRGHSIRFGHGRFWIKPELRDSLPSADMNVKRFKWIPFIRMEKEPISLVSEYYRHEQSLR